MKIYLLWLNNGAEGEDNYSYLAGVYTSKDRAERSKEAFLEEVSDHDLHGYAWEASIEKRNTD